MLRCNVAVRAGCGVTCKSVFLDRLTELFSTATSLVGPRRRRRFTHGGHAHIELRDLAPDELTALARRLVNTLEARDGIAWASVNPFTNRAVVAFDADVLTEVDVVAAVAQVEASCGFDDRPFRAEGPEHPGDLEPIVRSLIELGADVVGFWLAMLGRIASVRVLPIQIDVFALTALFEGAPNLRRFVDDRLGAQTSGLFLGVATAIAQGIVQNPLGPLIDVAYRALQIGERTGRRKAWTEREPELCAGPLEAVVARGIEPRPRALPEGPIERYFNNAFAGSVGAFGVGLAATGSVTDASAAMVAGLPRPARMGREAYAALLTRTLSARGVITLDPSALRRLDRVDCLVLPGDLADEREADVIIEVARRAGFHVEIVEDGQQLGATVRWLQQTGRVVLLVTDRCGEAACVADVAVGLCRDPRRAPWGAHVLATDSIDDARFIVDACLGAREAAEQGVIIAEAGVGFGLVFALGNRLEWQTGQRMMSIVNLATVVSMANGVRLAWRIAGRPALLPRDRVPWHSLEPREALEQLRSLAGGLSSEEASKRLEPHPPEPTLLGRAAGAMYQQLVSPFTPFLAAGAGLSAAVGSLADAVMVSGVMVVNAAIGAVQQLRADAAIAGLEDDQARRVRVLRDGNQEWLPTDELVVGDVMLLRGGEVVPADSRILAALGVEVDESSLTGESMPVRKAAAPSSATDVAERSSVLYAGTVVAAGEATAVVFATGERTEARRGLVAGGVPPQTGVESRLQSLVDLTGPAALVGGGIVTLAGIARGRPVQEVVGAGVGLAVAAVPEGLPLLATTAQLAAARRLSRRGTLVRNARSIEALGRANVLCVDKTGTLTEGRISLNAVSNGSRVFTLSELDAGSIKVLVRALQATPRPEAGGKLPHPTDAGLLSSARRLDVDLRQAWDWRSIAELPFEPERGYHAALGRDERGYLVAVKGAPEVVLPRCAYWRCPGGRVPLDDESRESLSRHGRELAHWGLRVLAVAEARPAMNGGLDDERVRDLTCVGFIGLSDPVRPTAKEGVDGLRAAGVRVIMMTGDHPSTAESIGAELGLLDRGRVMTGAELETLDEASLSAALEEATVIARVTPAHKAELVRALQRLGHVVVMTGDGANDALAIRLADVGVAFGDRATDAARAAADVVVTDDRIEKLVDAVLEGRAMWGSVRDAVSLLLGGNLGEMLFTVGASLAYGNSPLNARQLLLVNLLTDAAPAMAIALRPPRMMSPVELLREGPEASLGDALTRDILWRAAMTAGAAGGAFMASRRLSSPRRAGTVALVALVTAQLGQTLVAGLRSPVVVGVNLATFGALGAIVETPGISGVFGCTPLGPLGWTIGVGAGLAATGLSLVGRPIADAMGWFPTPSVSSRAMSDTSAPVGAAERNAAAQ
jgi:cation-transporting ATPase I